MITEEERRLKEAGAALRTARCKCGHIPRLEYEPGVTTIHCPRCDLWAVVPDFQPEAALGEWRLKLK